MLTENGKRWLAQHAGINGCFARSGISFYDADGKHHTDGSTLDVIVALYSIQLLGQDYYNKRVTEDGQTYHDFLTANDNQTITWSDLEWVRDNLDYCVTTEPTPTPQPPAPQEGKATVNVTAVDKDTGEDVQAQLVIDGIKNNVTPETLYLDPGDHVIRAFAKSYVAAEQPITVEANKTYNIKFKLVKMKPTTVRVTEAGEEEIPGLWVVNYSIPGILVRGEKATLSADVYSNEDVSQIHVDFEFYNKDDLIRGNWDGTAEDLDRFTPVKTYWTFKEPISAGETKTLVGTPTIWLSPGDYIVVYKLIVDQL